MCTSIIYANAINLTKKCIWYKTVQYHLLMTCMLVNKSLQEKNPSLI